MSKDITTTSGTASGNPALRRGLTFVSHAGEEKTFVKYLLNAIERAKVAAFFDDDMKVGTSAGNEMECQAAEADQAIVVLSRHFLTKEWPMKELNLFLKNKVKICPLYYKVTVEDVRNIMGSYDDRKVRGDNLANPETWREFMVKVRDSTRNAGSTTPPDHSHWREDVEKLTKLTGLPFEGFKGGEPNYIATIATMVSPPTLPDNVPPLPHYFVTPTVVEHVISKLLDNGGGTNTLHPVVSGMSGSGKSLIASAVVRDKTIRRYFSDGTLWLNDNAYGYTEGNFLQNLMVLAKQFQELVLRGRYWQGRAFQHEAIAFNAVQDAQEYFLEWKKRYNLTCLLVVDNTWNMKVLEAVDKMGFHILATTRNKALIPTGERWCQFPVPEIGEDDALLILKKCSGAKDSVPREPALQVATDCSFLPLALVIAGSTLLVMDKPLCDNVWRQLHEKLTNKDKIQLREGEERKAPNAVLDFSFEELGHTQQMHFIKLAVLAYDVVVSKYMLRYLWGKQDFREAQVAAMSLVARGLVQVRGDGYLVHDVLLEFARNRIKLETNRETKKTATSRQAQYLSRLNVVKAYRSSAHEGIGGYYSLATLWRSVEDLSGDKALEVKKYKSNLDVLTKQQASIEIASIFDAVASLFHMQGKRKEAIPLWKRALAILREVPEARDEDTNPIIRSLQRAKECVN